MSNKGGVPDAWDDDWVNVADKSEPKLATPETAPKLSKAERRAQHQQFQKQLWDTAENPSRNHWLETQGVVPLKQDFKTPVTLLSRKPPVPTVAKKADPANGVANLSLDDGEDSEEEARKKRETDFEERQRKAKTDREEKLRKYAEARERIMGTPTSGTPTAVSRESSHGRNNRNTRVNRNSQPTSADQSPNRAANTANQLFDPDDMGRRLPKSTTPTLDGPTRQPRGPESSGRGGFAARGGRAPV